MKNLITNITGAILAMVTILLVFNIINSDQALVLQSEVPILIVTLVTAVSSIVSIFFAKDKK